LFKNLIIQVIVFVSIFQFMSFIRETNMLSTDESVQQLSMQLPTLSGDSLTLAAKNKTTVFYFFAPWCEICHLSIGNLQSVYEKNDNIDVVAIALDFTSEEEVQRFISRHKLTFPIALGNDQVKEQFKIPGYPSYYVVDADNMITNKSMGYSTEVGLYLRSL